MPCFSQSMCICFEARLSTSVIIRATQSSTKSVHAAHPPLILLHHTIGVGELTSIEALIECNNLCTNALDFQLLARCFITAFSCTSGIGLCFAPSLVQHSQ